MLPTDLNHDTTSYQQAYQTLKDNAERLESYQEVDIDTLVNLVNDSIHAYKICQNRINAVEAALQEAFAQTSGHTSSDGL